MSHIEYFGQEEDKTNSSLDRWNQLIYDLQGTCNELNSFLERHNAEDLIDHIPFLEYLDNHIFLCDSCGWWCELSEMSDEGVCSDCCSNEYEE
jgi:hypothetical protein